MDEGILWTSLPLATVAADADELVMSQAGVYRRLTRALLNTSPTVRPTGAAAVGLTVQGVAAQTAALQQWLNSAAALLSQIGADGLLTAPGLREHPTLGFVLRNSGGGAVFDLFSGNPRFLTAVSFISSVDFEGEIRKGGYDRLDAVNLGARASAANKVAIVVKRVAGQTADLLQCQMSTGTVLCAIGPDGSFSPATMSDTVAPVNAIYFSSTSGALSYKNAAGTVKAFVLL